MRLAQVRGITLAACLLWTGCAAAAELVMFRLPGCPWCAAWDRDIGPVYPKTEIGRNIPIRFADLNRSADAGILLRDPVRYSPTFVLVDGGREIGRIEGYPGEDFFWDLLDNLVRRLPSPAPE
jgi:hypothetical protein